MKIKMNMGISGWINCGRVEERMNKYVIRREFGSESGAFGCEA